MILRAFIPLCLVLTSCSTLKQEVVDCPKLTAPRTAAEIVINSKNNAPIYIGIRGVKSYCTKASDKDIEMDINVNLRAIRKDIKKDDYAPITISVVSVDENNKEYDRDELSYSQFLLEGGKTVDRSSEMNLNVPIKGEVYLGIK
jgi:hypothetical protein